MSSNDDKADNNHNREGARLLIPEDELLSEYGSVPTGASSPTPSDFGVAETDTDTRWTFLGCALSLLVVFALVLYFSHSIRSIIGNLDLNEMGIGPNVGMMDLLGKPKPDTGAAASADSGDDDGGNSSSVLILNFLDLPAAPDGPRKVPSLYHGLTIENLWYISTDYFGAGGKKLNIPINLNGENVSISSPSNSTMSLRAFLISAPGLDGSDFHLAVDAYDKGNNIIAIFRKRLVGGATMASLVVLFNLLEVDDVSKIIISTLGVECLMDYFVIIIKQ